MKCIHLFILGLIVFGVTKLSAQEKMADSDSLIADFSFLVKQLEATHPDPYTGFGGKVFFHQQAFDLKNELREHPHTVKEFSDKVSVFLANLQDGHTYLMQSDNSSEKNTDMYPVTGRTIPGGLIIGAATKEYEPYLGSRILKINGLSLDSILHRVGTQATCENIYGQYDQLSRKLENPDLISALFPTHTRQELVLSIKTPEGIFKDLSLPLLSAKEIKKHPEGKITPANWEKMPVGNTHMAYDYIDDQQQVMLIKMKAIMGREAFEYQYQNNWNNWYPLLKSFYHYLMKEEMPADTLQALANIPSLAETFGNMLEEMKRNGSRTLIIDLRGNGGGWTDTTTPSLYQLYGDRYLQTKMNIRSYRLVSPLYLEKVNQTLDEFNKDHQSNYQLGNYTFYKQNNKPDTTSIESLRKQFIDNCMSSNKDILRSQNGKPLYAPEKVYVVIDPGTFSAAFHYTFFLWKMGATIVGIPSSQAANTFMEQTPFQLPYTQIEGSISNSIQVYLPGKDPRSKTFTPDIMLTYDDYKRYHFNQDAEILYLLDQLSALSK